jgi:hypothetical protein
MHKRFAKFGLLLTAAGLAVATQVSATTLIAANLGELTRMSDFVLVAKAQSRTSRKQVETGLIVTDVQLRVLTALKGTAKPGDTLTATVLGGTVGDVGLHVPGEARIPDDRSAIVFLRRTSNGELNVSGMGQGVMPITGQGKTAQVIPAAPDAALMQPDANGQLREAPAAAPEPQPLAAVLEQIRQLAGTSK